MRLRARRRDLVLWHWSVGSDGQRGASRVTPLTRRRRVRRGVRVCALLTVMGLMCLVRSVRGRLTLAGAVLTVAGVVLRDSPGGLVLLPGLLLLLSAPLFLPVPETDRARRSDLERELAAYSTPAHLRDLEATLDRYPDSITSELRDILASRSAGVRRNGIPGAGGFRPHPARPRSVGKCAPRM
jgi:hypothetical protein